MRNPEPSYDVVIAGAGAAGLYTAVLLHQHGYSVRVYDKNLHPSTHSRSIGIHPPSLALLDEIGLLSSFREQGLVVCEGRAMVTESASADGSGALRVVRNKTMKLGSGEGTDYVLVLPQNRTEALLAGALPEGTVERGMRVTDFQEEGETLSVGLEGAGGESTQVRARYLIGADGMYSDVRRLAGISWEGSTYKWPFTMGDFPDTTGFGNQAVIYLNRDGLVESFPMPDGLRRWVINVHPDTLITDDNDRSGRWHSATAKEESASGRPLELLTDAVFRRTGFRLHPADALVCSSFRAHRYRASTSVQGRVILVGDAAHVISPIGGQGMNFGWMNIRELVRILAQSDRVNVPHPLTENHTTGNKRHGAGNIKTNTPLTGSSARRALALTENKASAYNRFAEAHARRFGNRAHFNTMVGLPGKSPVWLGIVTDILLSRALKPLFVRRFTMR